MAGSIRHGVSPLTDYDIFLFKQGTHYHLYEKMGAQKFTDSDGTEGVAFSVWAPNAQEVSVVGNFNGWSVGAHPLAARWDGSGIWEGFVPKVGTHSAASKIPRRPLVPAPIKIILCPPAKACAAAVMDAAMAGAAFFTASAA